MIIKKLKDACFTREQHQGHENLALDIHFLWKKVGTFIIISYLCGVFFIINNKTCIV
jgi:hypothetical protein